MTKEISVEPIEAIEAPEVPDGPSVPKELDEPAEEKCRNEISI